MFEAILSGVGHTPFRAHEDSLETLLTAAVREALDDAQTPASEIDEVFLGHFGAGMDPQGFISSLVLNADPGLHLKPVHRLENACASGSAAVHAAVRSVMSGQSRCVLVAGVEKMSACDHVGQALATASYRAEEARYDSFAALFGEITEQYFGRFGNQENAMAQIAAKNHRNGLDNPLAQLRKDLSGDFCATVSEKNPRVAGALKRTDCSPVSDGAAALVISRPENVQSPSKSVRFRAIAQVSDYLPISRRDLSELRGCREAWNLAFRRAELAGVSDLHFVETHDCFTIAELMQYEAMGLAKPGQGYKALQEGWVMADGKLPVNRSGGLKAKGHPIGATGVSMHAMAALQLQGRANAMQLNNVSVGGVFNMGGSGVANYVSILSL
ncbi:MAG: thiolase domain-containing protein [Marinobacter sp.]|uniref:thiolase domain-containing protein n=1 Tax=Marinobacter sp. TaxID=50741 RepID=UPI00329A52EC